MKFTLALAQTDCAVGDLSRNIEKHMEYADRARDRGASLVLFPELSLTGYTVRDMNWDLAIRAEKPDASLRPLLELSREISIVAGGVEEGADFGIYNSAFLFEGGVLRTVHRKIYPPTYGMFEEMRYFSRGSSVRAFDSRHGRLGVLICEDLWHISLPYLLALDGASALLGLAASPVRLSGEEADLTAQGVNQENHKGYARLLSMYLAFCNRVGQEDGVSFWGGSELVGPDGNVEATSKLFEEDLILATLDDNEIRRSRRFSRHFLDEDRKLVLAEFQRLQ